MSASRGPASTVAPVPIELPQLSTGLWTFSAEDPGTWQPLLDRAVAADRAGVDRLVVSDHVVFGENLEAYGDPSLGGSAGGRQPTGPDGHWLEPLTTLAVIAGMTTRVRFGTNILLAALRRPVVLAKSAATLDVLSGGRLDLGVGVGWQREEYEAAGLDFEDRGRLLDHTLAVCRTLWGEQRASYRDDHLSFDNIHQMPKPVRSGGVPIWVSGTVNRRVARRLARFGTGWIPWGPAAADPVAGIPAMRALLAQEPGGRDWSDLQVVGNLPMVRTDEGVDLDATMAQVPGLVDAGVTDFRVNVVVPPDLDAATEELARVVTAFRAVVGRR
jgi:probable F420-dependent oxidoreductase